MYTEQLRYFALAYQMRSFSAAAKQIPMSPQGVAKSVHSLETELKVILFETDKNGELVPTSYADELLRFVNRFDAGFSILQESFNRIRAYEQREVRVGISLGILGYLGPDFLAGFRDRYPHIRLHYDEVNDFMCDEGLRKGSYSVILSIAPYDTGFIATELYTTPVYFWISADDPLSTKDSLSIHDFDGRSIALPGKGFKCYDYLLSLCQQEGVSLGEIFTSAEIFRLFEFAQRGNGLGFAARHLAELPLFKDNRTVVSLPLQGAYWKFGVARAASRPLPAADQMFFDYCLGYIRQHHES